MWVVVPGVQRDLAGAPGFRHRPHHIERLVSVEGGDLDGHHVLHLRHPPPESDRQKPAAHRRLQIESEHRDRFGDRADVFQQLGFGGPRQRRQANQSGMVAKIAGQSRFSQGRPGCAHDSSHP
jgi:hypothetical protein